NRILSGRPKLKYYEAGMDLGMSYDRAESFRLFQARILEEYDKMVDSDNFVVLDGTLPVNKLQKQMSDMVAEKIDRNRFAPRVAAFESGRTRHRRASGEKRGDAADIGADVCDGLLRSGRTPRSAGAALRHGGAGGSFYLHAHRARRRARNQSRLHERTLRHGASAASDVLAECASGNSLRARIPQGAGHQLLGSGSG